MFLESFKIEQVDFHKSKLVCPKIISNIVWDYGDVKNHWDNLIITSNVENQGKSVIYQEGKLLDILKIDNMLKLLNIKFIIGKGGCCKKKHTKSVLAQITEENV